MDIENIHDLHSSETTYYVEKYASAPKDRISDEQKPEVVYKIPCKNCERVYVGETRRPLGARVKEHRKEVDMMMKLPVLPCAEKLELVLSTAPKT